ncbi:MAG: glycosyl hydrolase 2 galactose-binding domain-containing protein [Oscillospiraceae bacterium]
MMIQSLNGPWRVNSADEKIKLYVNVPGTVYSSMLENKMIEDPFYRLNQYDALKISDNDFVFSYDFIPAESMLKNDRIYLKFDGIDTIAEIFLNNKAVGSADNMHRTYKFDVTDCIRPGTNSLRVFIHSPVKYIKDKNDERKLWGVASTMPGYPHIRKAHYMYGWDWGPVLPDAGIWRDVSLVGVKYASIKDVRIKQEHKQSSVKLVIDTEIEDMMTDNLRLECVVTDPDGVNSIVNTNQPKQHNSAVCVILNPKRWNVRGFGKQYLYEVKVKLIHKGEIIDKKELKIGLRTIEVSRQKDSIGEEFCFKVNGTKIFAMGANYIPEDNILGRCSRERTERLLKDCAAANYNMIRVWGGGYYPDDYFYDICDQLGLLVWQDMMFACSVYDGNDPAFCSTVEQELIDNVRRIDHHACLAMWCGNNEIESAWQYWGLPNDAELRQGYLNMFENIAPKVIARYDTGHFYWPSSPSSGGGFNDSGAKNKGDIHYWEVWHSLKPFTEYKKYLFRFCSEYGFESIPCMKTVRTFAEEKDLNLMSPVMEAHQKCEAGNEKLMYYLAQMVHYPYNFENLVYATQLVQADAIRLNVEQMRRHRGICMGSLYWQVNDCNPVISWSSIDYFGRWKALHYYARRFYAPIICSVDDSDKDNLVFNVSNEKTAAFSGHIKWKLRKNTTEVIAEGDSGEFTVPPLSAVNCFNVTKEMTGIDESSYSSCTLEYSLMHKDAIISNSTFLYCLPKQFEFLPPEISVKCDSLGDKFCLTFSSKAYAKGVYLDFDEFDVVFGDNWFDINGQDVSILLKKDALPPYFTPELVEEKLRIKSYADVALDQ